jgi:hypothetical protein
VRKNSKPSAILSADGKIDPYAIDDPKTFFMCNPRRALLFYLFNYGPGLPLKSLIQKYEKCLFLGVLE